MMANCTLSNVLAVAAKTPGQPIERIKPKKKRLSELLDQVFEPLFYLSKPLISEGLTIVAGRPKIGKTTLIRQLLVALSDGGSFLGSPCIEAETLFLCLEESERLAHRKFKQIIGNANVEQIDIQFEWPRGNDGIFALREYLTENPAIRLVVIDSLSRFREVQRTNAMQFQQDYEAVTALHTLTKDFPKLAIVLLHHTTKAKADDPLDCISGTYGITAAVDSYGVLQKYADKYRLHWGGRNWDSDNSDFELTRNGGLWQMAGEWDTSLTGLTPAQQQVMEILKTEGVVTARGMANRLGVSHPTASDHLKNLCDTGAIVRRGNDYSIS